MGDIQGELMLWLLNCLGVICDVGDEDDKGEWLDIDIVDGLEGGDKLDWMILKIHFFFIVTYVIINTMGDMGEIWMEGRDNTSTVTGIHAFLELREMMKEGKEKENLQMRGRVV